MKHILITALLLGYAAFALAREDSEEKRRDYWNVQDTPEHIYRQVSIEYYLPMDGADDTTLVTNLAPTPPGLDSPLTADACREDAIQRIDIYLKDLSYAGRHGEFSGMFLWVDWDSAMTVIRWDQAILTAANRKGYIFERIVCLPMHMVDDLDLVGTEHRKAYQKSYWEKRFGSRRNVHPSVWGKHDILLADDDPRDVIRYDADRFFARFAKYGITRTLSITREKIRSWEEKPMLEQAEKPWGNTMFLFPFIQSNQKRKPWNVQRTAAHVYRVVLIRYTAIAGKDEVSFLSLSTPPPGLLEPQMRILCTGGSIDNITLREISKEYEPPLHVLLADENAGIIVDVDEHGDYDAMRFICLPTDQIDDLDLVRSNYEVASDSVLPDNELPLPTRYDADRFFARFEKYGVTRTLPIPNKIKDDLHWDNDKWGTKIFIFPLDQSNE